MDFIKSQFDRIQQQLSGLTASQKMLSAALVAIMVMTLWWWGNYAGTPEYAPLLDQPMTAEDIGAMRTQLKLAGIEHQVTDDKILVPPDKKMDALGFLGYANALPKNTSSGFDQMIKQLTVFDGQERQAAIFNHAKELQLQQIIQRFPGVGSATVLIDPSSKFRIGRPVESTATVSVTLRDTTASSKKLAHACAHLVAGAQSGLKPSRVNVTINGQMFALPDDASLATGGIGGSQIEIQQQAEAHENRKLEEHLNYIPGVRVSVTVRVNSAREQTEKVTVDKEKSGTFEAKTTSKTTEEVTPVPANGDPGTNSNSGMSIGVASAAPANSTRSTNEDTVENLNVPATTKTQTLKNAGDTTVIAASVRVPRSYLVHEAKGGDPAAKEPDAAAIEKAIARVLPSIKSAVAANTGLKEDTAISVEPYTDLVVPPPTEAQLAGTGGFTTALGGHIKEITLGGLALASLFMMSMMVRKGAVAPVLPPAPVVVKAGAVSLTAGEDLAGEATEQNPTLDGMELDEDSIKTQQMLSQVTSMVGESPDTAAQLIKRWMNQR